MKKLLGVLAIAGGAAVLVWAFKESRKATEELTEQQTADLYSALAQECEDRECVAALYRQFYGSSRP